LTYREIARRLHALGCQELPRRGSGSHRKGHNPSGHRIAPVPGWGSKDLKVGTVRAIVLQLGLPWSDFSQS
jgi:predicted RNA binding protein YcfA (HicA-like mRNA interferase family)